MKRMFIVVIAIMFGFGLVGCNNDIKDGKFYSLEDAFDNGWLTNDDLSEIAEFYNNDTKPVELLDKDMEDRIKESY